MNNIIGNDRGKELVDIEGREWIKFNFATPIAVTSVDYWIGLFQNILINRGKELEVQIYWEKKRNNYANVSNTCQCNNNPGFSNMDMCISLGEMKYMGNSLSD